MNKLTPFILMLALLFAGEANAQSAPNCADGYPCQNVPWRLPVLPPLQSPTPIPTIAVTAVPTATPQPSSTPAPSPTGQAAAPNPLATLDLANLNGQVATLNAVIQGTPVTLNDAYGAYATPGGPDAYTTPAATFISYAKGISTLNFGMLTPLIVAFFGGFVLYLTLIVSGVVLPIGAALFGVLRRVVTLILDFLPL